MIPSLPGLSPPAPSGAGAPDLRRAAEKLEAAFLAEMLRGAGLGRAGTAFGGGIGEEQFASFLVEAQAAELARAGGIGLAESIFAALSGRRHDG